MELTRAGVLLRVASATKNGASANNMVRFFRPGPTGAQRAQRALLAWLNTSAADGTGKLLDHGAI
jgi:hypothetical protein